MKHARDDEQEIADSECQAKRLKSVPLPAEILALPHVVNRIDELAMSCEEAAMKAAATGQVLWLETLLPYISNYDVIFEIGAEHGHCAVIEAAYEWGELDDPSCEALLNAIEGGHIDALRCLLPKYSCDLRDVLDEALETEQQVMIEMVAEAVCRNSTDHDDTFYWAVGKGILEVVEGLHDEQGEMTLYFAMTLAAQFGCLNIIKFLHEDNLYDSHVADGEGLLPPIVIAAENGHVDIVKFLFDNDGYMGTIELDKAFTAAASGGHLEVVKYFLANEVNQPSFLKNAFTHAARYGQLEVVKFLYSRECRPSPDDAFRQAAGGHLEAVGLLFGNEASKISLLDKSLVRAAKGGHLEVVKFLFDIGANESSLLGDALVKAATWGGLKVVEYLFNNGANQIPVLSDAFAKAVAADRLEVMKFLYENGGRSVDEGSFGTVTKSHVEMVEILCNSGENKTALLNDAFTKAAMRGDLFAMSFLLDNGVNPVLHTPHTTPARDDPSSPSCCMGDFHSYLVHFCFLQLKMFAMWELFVSEVEAARSSWFEGHPDVGFDTHQQNRRPQLGR